MRARLCSLTARAWPSGEGQARAGRGGSGTFRECPRPGQLQYAAATLYQLLTDQTLFDGVTSPVDLFLKILQEKPVPLPQRRPDLLPALAAVVHRALAAKPEERYPRCAEFRQALLPFAAG